MTQAKTGLPAAPGRVPADRSGQPPAEKIEKSQALPRERQRPDDDDPSVPRPAPRHDSPELDPWVRCLAADASGAAVGSPPATEAAARVESARAVLVESSLQSLVRRAAWGRSPDGRTATLHLEIGDGPLAGATVLITADSRDLNIELDAPPDIDLEAWKTRLRHRLASQGLTASIS